MREFRTQESKKFEKFFNIVRSEADKQNSIFFCDCGEGREFFTNDMEGEDLFGWLIPKEKADEFEIEWKTNKVTKRWNDFVRFAIWQKEGDLIFVVFKEF